jgi:hypothetical protein
MSKELNAKLIAVATTVSENWKELNHYEWDKELKKSKNYSRKEQAPTIWWKVLRRWNML